VGEEKEDWLEETVRRISSERGKCERWVYCNLGFSIEG
jgi:hypothetical protein